MKKSLNVVDKNGKVIYEGDKVLIRDIEFKGVAFVHPKDNRPCLFDPALSVSAQSTYFVFPNWDDVEVLK